MRLLGWIALHWLSIHAQAVSSVAWLANPKGKDAGDDDTTYPDFAAGLANYWGLACAKCVDTWNDMRKEFPAKFFHNLKGFSHDWMRDYTKRGVKISALAFVVLELVAVAGWAVVLILL